MFESFASLKELYWKCDWCAFLGHLFSKMRSNDRTLEVLLKEPTSTSLDADVKAHTDAVEQSLRRFLARLDKIAKPELLAAQLKVPDSEECLAAKEMLETALKLEKANTILLRSLCAELETFIDNRGPLLAAPLEFAAAGELEDEEIWSPASVDESDPIMRQIAPRIKSLDEINEAENAANKLLKDKTTLALQLPDDTPKPAPPPLLAPPTLPAAPAPVTSATEEATVSSDEAAPVQPLPALIPLPAPGPDGKLPMLPPPLLPLPLLPPPLLPPPTGLLPALPPPPKLPASTPSPAPTPKAAPPAPDPEDEHSETVAAYINMANNSSTGALFQSVVGANSLLDVYVLTMIALTVQLCACDLLQLSAEKQAATTAALKISSHVTKSGLPLIDRLLNFLILDTIEVPMSPNAAQVTSPMSLGRRSSISAGFASTLTAPNASPAATSPAATFGRRSSISAGFASTLSAPNSSPPTGTSPSAASSAATSFGRRSSISAGFAATLGGPTTQSVQLQFHESMMVWVSLVRRNLHGLSFEGIGVGRGGAAKNARMLIRKCRLLDDFARAFDVVLFPWTLTAHAGSIKHVAISHMSKAITLTASYDRTIRIWDMPSRTCLAQFVGHSSIVTWAAFGPRDQQVYSCSFDGAIRIWSASTGAVHQELNAHTDSVVMCDVSANEELLCSASLDGTVRVWLLSTGKLLRTFRGHRHYVKVARFTPNGEAVVSAGLDREIMCWDLHEDSIGALWVTHAAHEDHILDLICVPPDAFISCSRDQTVKCWSLSNGHQRWSVKYDPVHWACSLSLSSGANLLATASLDNTIALYRVKNGQLLRQLRVHQDGIMCMRFLTDDVLVLGSTTGKVHLLQL